MHPRPLDIGRSLAMAAADAPLYKRSANEIIVVGQRFRPIPRVSAVSRELGLKIAEHMASGVPLLVYDCAELEGWDEDAFGVDAFQHGTPAERTNHICLAAAAVDGVRQRPCTATRRPRALAQRSRSRTRLRWILVRLKLVPPARAHLGGRPRASVHEGPPVPGQLGAPAARAARPHPDAHAALGLGPDNLFVRKGACGLCRRTAREIDACRHGRRR